MHSGRRTIVISGIVSAVAIVLLLWMLRDDARSSPIAAPPNETPIASASPVAVVSVLPPPAASPTPSLSPDQLLELAQKDTPISPEPAKREEKLSLADQIARRQAGLKLLDDLVAKVEKDRAAAEKAGDTEAAKVAAQRLGRLKKVRALREKELADIADGGVVDAAP